MHGVQGIDVWPGIVRDDARGGLLVSCRSLRALRMRGWTYGRHCGLLEVELFILAASASHGHVRAGGDGRCLRHRRGHLALQFGHAGCPDLIRHRPRRWPPVPPRPSSLHRSNFV